MCVSADWQIGLANEDERDFASQLPEAPENGSIRPISCARGFACILRHTDLARTPWCISAGIACVFSLVLLCGCVSLSLNVGNHDPIQGSWVLINDDGSLNQDYECTFESNGKWSCDWLIGKYGEGSGSWQNETKSYLDHKGISKSDLVNKMSEEYEIEKSDVQVYVMDADSDVESVTLLLEDEEGHMFMRMGSADGTFLLLGKY